MEPNRDITKMFFSALDISKLFSSCSVVPQQENVFLCMSSLLPWFVLSLLKYSLASYLTGPILSLPLCDLHSWEYPA